MYWALRNCQTEHAMRAHWQAMKGHRDFCENIKSKINNFAGGYRLVHKKDDR